MYREGTASQTYLIVFFILINLAFSYVLIMVLIIPPTVNVNVTVYRKTGHNAACVNIEKRSIDFLKMYCFKPTEGNG